VCPKEALAYDAQIAQTWAGKLAADLKGLTLRSDRELRCAGHVRAMHEDGSKQPPPEGALKETGPNHLGLGPHSNLFSDYFLTFVFLAFAAEP
jgi:hypothetical protein